MDLKNKFLQAVRRVREIVEPISQIMIEDEYFSSLFGAEYVSRLNDRQKHLLRLMFAAVEPRGEEKIERFLPQFLEMVEGVEDDPKYSRRHSHAINVVYLLLTLALIILVVFELSNRLAMI